MMRVFQASILGLTISIATACSSDPAVDNDDDMVDPATPSDAGAQEIAACTALGACCSSLSGTQAVSCNGVVASGAGCADTLVSFQADGHCGGENVGPVDSECTIPGSDANFGASVGRTVRPFTLAQCDGAEYSFYNDDYCDSKFTVISIAAEWCAPCQVESAMLEERINSVYASQGVRVIQILVQDVSFGPPTLELCNRWVDRYGLSNVELIDPAGVTQIYFPDNSLPSTIIVDSEGVIRFRENGVSDELIGLRAKLDELLAEDGGE